MILREHSNGWLGNMKVLSSPFALLSLLGGRAQGVGRGRVFDLFTSVYEVIF